MGAIESSVPKLHIPQAKIWHVQARLHFVNLTERQTDSMSSLATRQTVRLLCNAGPAARCATYRKPSDAGATYKKPSDTGPAVHCATYRKPCNASATYKKPSNAGPAAHCATYRKPSDADPAARCANVQKAKKMWGTLPRAMEPLHEETRTPQEPCAVSMHMVGQADTQTLPRLRQAIPPPDCLSQNPSPAKHLPRPPTLPRTPPASPVSSNPPLATPHPTCLCSTHRGAWWWLEACAPQGMPCQRVCIASKTGQAKCTITHVKGVRHAVSMQISCAPG